MIVMENLVGSTLIATGLKTVFMPSGSMELGIWMMGG
jgi:hypothetical protein